MYETEIDFLEKTLNALVFWEQRPQVAQIVSSLIPEKHASHLLERILKLEALQGQENTIAFIANSRCRMGSRIVIFADHLRHALNRKLPKRAQSYFAKHKNYFEKKSTNGTMHGLIFSNAYIHRLTFFGRRRHE